MDEKWLDIRPTGGTGDATVNVGITTENTGRQSRSASTVFGAEGVSEIPVIITQAGRNEFVQIQRLAIAPRAGGKFMVEGNSNASRLSFHLDPIGNLALQIPATYTINSNPSFEVKNGELIPNDIGSKDQYTFSIIITAPFNIDVEEFVRNVVVTTDGAQSATCIVFQSSANISVIDNLESNLKTQALSANMGRVLNEKIEAIDTTSFLKKDVDQTTKGIITSLEGQKWGEYKHGESGAWMDSQGNLHVNSIDVRSGGLSYVDLITDQAIKGIKTFEDGIVIGRVKLSYDEINNAIKGESLENGKTAGIYLDGFVSAKGLSSNIGGGGGGGMDETLLWNILGDGENPTKQIALSHLEKVQQWAQGQFLGTTALSAYYTGEYVETNFVKKTFLTDNYYTREAIDLSFLKKTELSTEFEKEMAKWFKKDNKGYIYTETGFYSNSFVSAKGLSSNIGGGSSASALYQLVDVVPNESNSGVFGATEGSVLTYSETVGKWIAAAGGVDRTKLWTILGDTGTEQIAKNHISDALNGYATETFVINRGYLIATISDKNNWNTAYSWGNHAVVGYLKSITKAQVEGVLTGDVTSHNHDTRYYTKTDSDGKYALITSVNSGLNLKADKTTTINAGTGLAGGGDLTDNRTLSLSTVGTAGTYTKVSVDAYGRVSNGSVLIAGDIPTLEISKIVGLQNSLDSKLDKTVFNELFEKVNIGTVDSPRWAIKFKFGAYSDEFISAKGLSQNIGGGGGMDETLLWSILGNSGTEKINNSHLNIASWALQANKPSYSYSEITGTPPAVDLSNCVTLSDLQIIRGQKTFTAPIFLNHSVIGDGVDNVSLYTKEFGGQGLNIRRLLVSGTYADQKYVPDQGAYFVGDIKASSFVKHGGTANQVLRADGGVSSFNWIAQQGQPEWIWGGNSPHDYFVWNPANFRVANANAVGDVGLNRILAYKGTLVSNVNFDNLLEPACYFNQIGNGANNSNYQLTYSVDLVFGGDAYISQLQHGAGNSSLAIRQRWDGVWSPWKTIPFENGNIESANRLRHARSIWGQPFDGTGNVDGDLRTSGAVYSSASLYAADAVYASGRIFTGYDSGIAQSMSCANWFRSSGNTGWFSAEYGGGIHMNDATFVRIYNAKKFRVDNSDYDSFSSNGGFYSNKDTSVAITNENIFSIYNHLFSNVFTAVGLNTYQGIVNWRNTINGVGYNTSYSIGSVRQGAWGAMLLAVSDRDDNSHGHSMRLSGNGDARWSGTFTVDDVLKSTIGRLDLGLATLRYDAVNKAVYFVMADGTPCGIYSDSFVSAKGLSPAIHTELTNRLDADETILASLTEKSESTDTEIAQLKAENLKMKEQIIKLGGTL